MAAESMFDNRRARNDKELQRVSIPELLFIDCYKWHRSADLGLELQAKI